jgi:hypothetical protein
MFICLHSMDKVPGVWRGQLHGFHCHVVILYMVKRGDRSCNPQAICNL